MTSLLPDGHGVLRERYGVRLPEGALVYERGTVLRCFYVVISGRVRLEAEEDGGGAPTTVRELKPGDCFGYVAAFSRQPAPYTAVTTEAAVIATVPLQEAARAFVLAPELAVTLITTLSEHQGPLAEMAAAASVAEVASAPPAADAPRAPVPAADDADVARAPSVEDAPRAPAPEAAPVPPPPGTTQSPPFNEQWFFVDESLCPVCSTLFEHLRVRTGAVRPTTRDSDFRILYEDLDPTSYAVLVCPECSYAAFHDDFEKLTATEIRALQEAQPERDTWGRPNLVRERTLDDGATALDLALICYRVRRADDRRRAGLLHRCAWVERARDDTALEMDLLEQACGLYRSAYERDDSVTDAEATRAAYLIGDLHFRLGDIGEATRWFSRCVATPEGRAQAGILRMARDRLTEARAQLRDGDRVA